MTATTELLESYFRLMSTNGAAQVLRAARAINLLEAMQQGADTAASIAAACGTQARPTALLLDALAALGLVDRREDRYRPAPVTHLLRGNYRDLGDSYWQHLPHYLETGAPLMRMDTAAESERAYREQAAALAWMMAPAAEAAANALAIGTQRRDLAVLDVGAGAAPWSLAIARRDSGTRVTALDWPAVLEVARRAAAGAGLADRLTTIAGDFHRVELPAGAFDLAILANVTHLETPDGNRALFRRIHAALRPGGEIAVIDVLPTAPAGALPAALYALGLALRTAEGTVHAPTALAAWLAAACFATPTLTRFDLPPHTMGMLLAAKPR